MSQRVNQLVNRLANRLTLLGLLTACMLWLASCGGGSGSSGVSTGSNGGDGSTSGAPANNVQAIVVDSGPAAAGGTINEPFVSVTICSPNAPTNCQTIDHILVDTGSTGLRILSSVISTSLALPQQTDSNGNAVVECTSFADGYSWGPIKSVNLRIAGETANGLAVQVIGDPAFASQVPQTCSASGAPENTVASFGANGVLGVGLFAQDCGGACAQNANVNVYYLCSTSFCQSSTLSLVQQLQNPITLFASDNNGVIVALPAIAVAGADSVSGTMIFGIGTQSNNGLGIAMVYTANPDNGFITTTYKGVAYPDSFLDSGSNGLYFNDASIPQCSDGSGFYCPGSTLNLTALISGANSHQTSIAFSVGNALSAEGSSISAYRLLAGTNGDPSSFDWGLPFFFGRNVYTAIENRSTPGGNGPYFAF